MSNRSLAGNVKSKATPSRDKIPFTKPYLTGRELAYVQKAIESGKLGSGGPFLQACEKWLQDNTKCKMAFLTTSGTTALEFSALVHDIGPGDEVIMPSFTFVSTANAFVLRGATPVFVDIRQDTLNMDETKIEAAISAKTKAIVPVHYAGVACEMDAIKDIAADHKLAIVEDAAQTANATYKGHPLGSIGSVGAISFHETKNIVAGEAGALLVNDETLIDRAITIRDKGTNRRRMLLGETDKYTWVDVGSNYFPSELAAAFLLAQLEASNEITSDRLRLWSRYHLALRDLETLGQVTLPHAPEHCAHNGNIFFVLLPTRMHRDTCLKALNDAGISAMFHFTPLHSSPAGTKFGRSSGDLSVTEDTAGRLLRLPLFVGMTDEVQDYIVETLASVTSGL